MKPNETSDTRAKIRDDDENPTSWRPLTIADTSISVWCERDRLHISIRQTDSGRTLGEWWDDDAREMFEDGFFKSGRPFGKVDERDPVLHASVFEYLQHVGIV